MAELTVWRPALLTDKAAIRAFLDRDRVLSAYALGDLDDAFWPQSTFYGAQRDGDLRALVLLYRGLEPTVLTAFGEPDAVDAILSAVDLPGEIYTLLPPALEPVLSARYALHNPHREWRMTLDPAHFVGGPVDGVVRLGSEDAGALANLYRHAAEPGEAIAAFSPWQIAHGVFYGVWEGSALIAAAGTHVWSQAERVAAIGNVFTRPDRRGRGLAARCTAAVVRDALAAGLDPVVLNVRTGNDPAIHIYEKLGFYRVCPLIEGPALARRMAG